jgi:trk system potassium uptake protein TrkA
MKFIIVGFGRVGMRTARILQSEGHDVVVVDTDGAKIDRARDEGFPVVQGDGTDESILEDAGIVEAEAIAALTGDLNTNFSICVIGDSHDCRTVLRVSEEVSEDLYEKYASDVDEIIYPERVGAAGAKTALLGGDFNVLADLTENLSVASVTIPDDSPVIDDRVVELTLPGDARIYAHGREDESMTVPLPQTRIEAGDSLAIMADPAVLDEVRAQLRGEATAA